VSNYGNLLSMSAAINVDEPIGKWVGRRSPEDPAKLAAGLQRLVNQVARSQQRGICPKGVFRFRTHEQADEWLLKMMVRQAAKS
jgi:hypothetical protein